MSRLPPRPIGTLQATRESDGAAVSVSVYREMHSQRFSEGHSVPVEGGRVFKLSGTTLRVDGSDTRYLTDGRERYLTAEPLA